MPPTEGDLHSRSELQQYERDLKALKEAYDGIAYAPHPILGIRSLFGTMSTAPNPKLVALRDQMTGLERIIHDGWAARSPQLPVDVIQCTLDNFIGVRFYEPPSGSGPAISLGKFITELCLVCRAWLAPARRVLYHDVGLEDGGRRELFIRTIQEAPDVRGFVRRIIGCPGDFFDGAWLSLLPNCTAALAIDVRSEDNLASGWPKIVAQDLKQLKKISVYGFECEPIEGLTQHFSHLEVLELEEYDFQICQVPFPCDFDGAFFSSLKVLSLTENCRNVSFPPTSPNTLQELYINRCFDMEPWHFLEFIRSHANSLVTIDISEPDFPSSKVVDVFAELAKEAVCAQRLDLDLNISRLFHLRVFITRRAAPIHRSLDQYRSEGHRSSRA
jgi:hypothetical protein